jgi:hypothetical protein
MRKHDECREFLESYRGLLLETDRLSSSARILWDTATGITSHLTGMPRSGPGADVKTALAAATDAADARLREALKKREEIERFVQQVPGQMNRYILSLRYIDLLTWVKIAERLENTNMPYSDRNIYVMHGRALEAARALWDETYHINNKEESQS